MNHLSAPIVLLTVAFPWTDPPDPNGDELERHAVPIRSIDPLDHDFADLEFLIDVIGDARFVVLGEATHNEGATSAIKARLAMFLHSCMGFDVVAWEAGVLACAEMDDALRDSSIELSDATGKMMYGGWDGSESVWPLFEYARESWETTRPLRMAGFDGEKPPLGAKIFGSAVRRARDVGAIELSKSDEGQLMEFASRAFGYFGSDDVSIDPDVRDEQLEVVLELERALRSEAAQRRMSPVARGLLLRSIRQGLASEERKERAVDDTSPWLHARDPYMARTFHWLATQRFAGHKIIIWAATAHMTRETPSMQPINRSWSYAGSEHMGDGVFRDFGEQLYTIAVTSHHGETGTIFPAGDRRERFSRTGPIAPLAADSFESLAHALDHPYLFVDLRGAPETSWLRGEFIAHPIGFIPIRCTWSRVIDSFLFIDEMWPDYQR